MTLESFMRWVLAASALLLFIGGFTLAAMTDQTTNVGLSYTAAVFCLIFLFLSKFKKFEGMGIKAEMWEQVQEEAESIIHEVKRLALTTASPVAFMAAKIGYYGGNFTNKELYNLMAAISDSLQRNGISKDEIEKVKLPLHGRVVRSLIFDFLREVGDKLQEKNSAENTQIDRDFPQPIRDAEGYSKRYEKVRAIGMATSQFRNYSPEDKDYADTYSQLMQMLDSLEFLSAPEKAAFKEKWYPILTELKYYCENGDFKNPQIWFEQAPH